MIPHVCPRCRGKGEYDDPIDGKDDPIRCHPCGGTGIVWEKTEVENRERKPE